MSKIHEIVLGCDYLARDCCVKAMYGYVPNYTLAFWVRGHAVQVSKSEFQEAICTQINDLLKIYAYIDVRVYVYIHVLQVTI